MHDHIKDLSEDPPGPVIPTPLSIEWDDLRDEVIIEGVRYSAHFFRTNAWPSSKYLYAMSRADDIVQLKEIHNAQEAEAFFFLEAYGPGGE